MNTSHTVAKQGYVHKWRRALTSLHRRAVREPYYFALNRTPSYHAKADAPSIQQLYDEIKSLLVEKNAVVIAHYYTDEILQQLAEETGGFVGDSLEMARFGRDSDAETLVVSGVRFMGETAKILNPQKRILMPALEATCSLDLGCPIDEFESFCNKYPERTVVVYANTSADVKARADWVVTSSIAKDVIEHLHDQGQSILWAPDKYLGAYIQRITQTDMVIWDGACVVHEEFKAQGIAALKHTYPDALVLAHPESPPAVLDISDYIGSTSGIINAAHSMDNNRFIVATEQGILYQLRQKLPHKEFISAPTAGEGATCQSCARCPWMKMNSIQDIHHILLTGENEITLQPDVRQAAMQALQRMLNFKKT